jgi:hypothetical protein
MVLHFSSLGGHSFLEAMMLPVTSFRFLNLADAGLGLIVTLGLIHYASRRAGISARQAVLLMLFVTLLPLPHVSLSALRLGIAMLLGAALTAELLDAEMPGSFRANVLMALVLAGVCCLKNTFIATAGGFFLAFYGLRLVLRRDWRVAVKDIAAVTALGALLLLPWMIAMHRSGGTYLFPILGIGYHRAAFDASFWTPFGGCDWASVVSASQSDFLLVIAEVAGAAWLFSRPWRTPRNWAALALLAATLISSLALSMTTFGTVTGRYNFPADVAALAMLSCFAFRGSADSTGIAGARTRPVLATALTLAVALGIALSRPWPPNSWQRLRAAIPELAASAEESTRDALRLQVITQAQEAVPEGACILARLSWPSFLDFTRNTVYVVDRPGVFSLPPGMPLGEGAERLAQYLTASGIAYVMYSYGDEANYGPSVTAPRIANPTFPWQRPEALATVAFQKDLMELPRCRRKIYDDGFFMVVDLRRAASE